jgi:hypothetical protein
MKKIIYLIIIYVCYSCTGQTTGKLKIDASKVKKIEIINKVDCSFSTLVREKTIITDRDKIENIIEKFSYMEPIQDRGSISMNVNHGFFELKFYEGDKYHYYTINYTVYYGVIIWSNDGGKVYKNDRLEIVVDKEFRE